MAIFRLVIEVKADNSDQAMSRVKRECVKIISTVEVRPPLTLVRFFNDVHKDLSEPSVWRLGQRYFNTLYRLRPDFANKIRSTEADCFFDDRKIGAFITKLQLLIAAERDESATLAQRPPSD